MGHTACGFLPLPKAILVRPNGHFCLVAVNFVPASDDRMGCYLPHLKKGSVELEMVQRKEAKTDQGIGWGRHIPRRKKQKHRGIFVAFQHKLGSTVYAAVVGLTG